MFLADFSMLSQFDNFSASFAMLLAIIVFSRKNQIWDKIHNKAFLSTIEVIIFKYNFIK